jgi:hypothetical protein
MALAPRREAYVTANLSAVLANTTLMSPWNFRERHSVRGVLRYDFANEHRQELLKLCLFDFKSWTFATGGEVGCDAWASHANGCPLGGDGGLQ